MKICDEYFGDPSGGKIVETWESKREGCLAISIMDEGASDQNKTATLSPAACLALGLELLNHALANGMKIPRLE